MVTVNILDASAFITGGIPRGKIITEEDVYQEVKDKKSKLEMKLDSVNVRRAKSKYIEKIKATSKQTGDSKKLSSADKKLIALALEFNQQKKDARLISDDYAIQNTCEELNIPYKGIRQNEIDQKIAWKQICKGCKKTINQNDLEECPYCGSDLRMVPKAKKDISSNSNK